MDHKFTLRYIDITNILDSMTDSKKRVFFSSEKIKMSEKAANRWLPIESNPEGKTLFFCDVLFHAFNLGCVSNCFLFSSRIPVLSGPRRYLHQIKKKINFVFFCQWC
jgi:hypothetical protein